MGMRCFPLFLASCLLLEINLLVKFLVYIYRQRDMVQHNCMSCGVKFSCDAGGDNVPLVLPCFCVMCKQCLLQQEVEARTAAAAGFFLFIFFKRFQSPHSLFLELGFKERCNRLAGGGGRNRKGKEKRTILTVFEHFSNSNYSLRFNNRI